MLEIKVNLSYLMTIGKNEQKADYGYPIILQVSPTIKINQIY